MLVVWCLYIIKFWQPDPCHRKSCHLEKISRNSELEFRMKYEAIWRILQAANTHYGYGLNIRRCVSVREHKGVTIQILASFSSAGVKSLTASAVLGANLVGSSQPNRSIYGPRLATMLPKVI